MLTVINDFCSAFRDVVDLHAHIRVTLMHRYPDQMRGVRPPLGISYLASQRRFHIPVIGQQLSNSVS
jgi:hypothetical protein